MVTRRFTSRVLSLLCLVVLLAPATLGAQSTTALETASQPRTTPSGLTSCFDYYRFGSTPVTISGSLSEVTPGTKMGLVGTIKNENPYPLEGLRVTAKLFKIRGGGEKDVNGPDVLGIIPVTKDFALKAGEEKPLSFEVEIPTFAEPGQYRIVTFVTALDRFELLGLTFTDDVVGGIFDVKVVGGVGGSALFDKTGVAINGNPYSFASYPPVLSSSTKDAVITARISNSSKDAVKGSVSWSLYAWSGDRKEQLLDTQTSSVKLVSKQSTEVSYTVNDTAHSVYYLEGKFTSERGDSSYIGVRFVREDVFEPRLSFIGATEDKTTGADVAFVCVHSMGMGDATDATLRIDISRNGKMLGDAFSKVYTGVIPGDMNALVLPLKDLPSRFEVTATLSQHGKQLDKVTTVYSCEDLGFSCDDSLWSQAYTPITATGTSRTVLYAGILLFLLVSVAYAVWHRRQHPIPPPFTHTPPTP